jgi:DNA-binding transcriptional LysR family regulator
MHDVHLSAVDLNLLVALDALMRERHVTRAAKRVGLTQSAMSHALARLRELFGDELLVRTPRGMEATVRGVALAPMVREALAQVSRVLAPRESFDPLTLEREFVIATADYGAMVLVPALLARLRVVAPRVKLRVMLPTLDAEAELSRGTVDLTWNARPPPLPPRLMASKLWDDRFVCVVRRDHPRVGKRMTLARFLELDHAQIAVRGLPGGPVDDALAAIGKERRVVFFVAHFLVAPRIVAESDLVLVLAERMARLFEKELRLKVLPVPVLVSGFEIWQLWHPRMQSDPAHTSTVLPTLLERKPGTPGIFLPSMLRVPRISSTVVLASFSRKRLLPWQSTASLNACVLMTHEQVKSPSFHVAMSSQESIFSLTNARAAAGMSPPPFHTFTNETLPSFSSRLLISMPRTFGRYGKRSMRLSRYAANTTGRGNGRVASARSSMRALYRARSAKNNGSLSPCGSKSGLALGR